MSSTAVAAAAAAAAPPSTDDAAATPAPGRYHVQLCSELTLTTAELVKIGQGNVHLSLSEAALQGIDAARAVIDAKLASGEVVYGVNTGFGLFATTVISNEKVSELQYNLIRSHACGVGEPLSPQLVRMLFALRINVISKGRSGMQRKNVLRMIEIFNADVLPFVPSVGTVGASGDLAPLSHLAMGVIGEGLVRNPRTGKYEPAEQVFAEFNLTPVQLEAKEGLALINGTQLIASIGALATARAHTLSRTADTVAALTIEVLRGTARAFDPKVHAARPHSGQIAVAAHLLQLMRPGGVKSSISKAHETCTRVQDSYSLRCIPQVHGIVRDTIAWVESVLDVELNSATDNPMVFAETSELISAGNFHGEYPAKMCDYLAIGVQEIANISERRQERLMNNSLNGELPPFLVREGGLNSGFMIAHCTSAALTSENKGLCHPSSVDTISTSAAKEDHVSMGGWAARKALQVVENCEIVVAIELLMAVQALDLSRPLQTTPALEAVYDLVRTVVKPWDKDRYMKPDIDAATELVRSGKVLEVVAPFVSGQH